VQYDSGESQPQRGGNTGTQVRAGAGAVAQPTLDTATLPHSSETAEQRLISELEQADHRRAANRSRSHRRRITQTPDETVARLSAQRDSDSQKRRRSADYFEVEGRYFPQALLYRIRRTSSRSGTACSYNFTYKMVPGKFTCTYNMQKNVQNVNT